MSRVNRQCNPPVIPPVQVGGGPKSPASKPITSKSLEADNFVRAPMNSDITASTPRMFYIGQKDVMLTDEQKSKFNKGYFIGGPENSLYYVGLVKDEEKSSDKKTVYKFAHIQIANKKQGDSITETSCKEIKDASLKYEMNQMFDKKSNLKGIRGYEEINENLDSGKTRKARQYTYSDGTKQVFSDIYDQESGKKTKSLVFNKDRNGKLLSKQTTAYHPGNKIIKVNEVNKNGSIETTTDTYTNNLLLEKSVLVGNEPTYKVQYQYDTGNHLVGEKRTEFNVHFDGELYAQKVTDADIDRSEGRHTNTVSLYLRENQNKETPTIVSAYKWQTGEEISRTKYREDGSVEWTKDPKEHLTTYFNPSGTYSHEDSKHPNSTMQGKRMRVNGQLINPYRINTACKPGNGANISDYMNIVRENIKTPEQAQTFRSLIQETGKPLSPVLEQYFQEIANTTIDPNAFVPRKPPGKLT